MKKLILLFVLIGQLSLAQVNNYNFTLFNQTYTPLVGVKTVFQMGSQLNTDEISEELKLYITPFHLVILLVKKLLVVVTKLLQHRLVILK